jgi:hypothetical protein
LRRSNKPRFTFRAEYHENISVMRTEFRNGRTPFDDLKLGVFGI